MKSLKVAALTLALLASGSAFAAQKDITVVADVDPTLDLLQPDGSALPQTVRMNYVPGVGLQPVSIMTKIFTNDITKSVKIRLIGDSANKTTSGVVLTPMVSTGTPVDITVKYNGKLLTPNDLVFAVTDLNYVANTDPTDPTKTLGVGSSQAMPLEISQTKRAPLGRGSYQGVVSVVLTQSA